MTTTAAGEAAVGGGPIRYGVVGSGYRTQVFVKLAERLPDVFTLAGVVTRSDARADQIAEDWSVPGYTDLEQFLDRQPVDFMITSTPFAVTPVVVEQLVEAGVRVLAETPPAPNRDGLAELWQRVGDSGLVQVAEQYPYAPGNLARKALLDTGALGDITWVHVSSTQHYHAMALLRQMLGAGFAPAEIRAQSYELPVVDPQTRAGWADDLVTELRTSTLATLDFGGRVGVYDYTANQVRNPIRGNRMLIRGTHGELADDHLVRLAAPHTPLESELRRWQTGGYLNFEERDLYQIGDGDRVLWRNPYFGASLSEEEIAVANLLGRTGQWARGDGAPPYPLAEAAQDQLLALAVAEAAESGETVRIASQGWASTGSAIVW